MRRGSPDRVKLLLRGASQRTLPETTQPYRAPKRPMPPRESSRFTRLLTPARRMCEIAFGLPARWLHSAGLARSPSAPVSGALDLGTGHPVIGLRHHDPEGWMELYLDGGMLFAERLCKRTGSSDRKSSGPRTRGSQLPVQRCRVRFRPGCQVLGSHIANVTVQRRGIQE